MVNGININIERKDSEGFVKAWRTMMCNHIYGNDFCKNECEWCDYN